MAEEEKAETTEEEVKVSLNQGTPSPDEIEDMTGTEEKPEAEEEEHEPKQTDAGFDGRRMCPRCGFDTTQAVVADVTEDDKRAFLASILGETQYEKEVDIFNGNAKLYFRARKVELSELIERQLNVDKQLERMTDIMAYETLLLRYNLATCLTAYRIKGKEKVDLPEIDLDKRVDTDTSIQDTALPVYIQKVFGKWNDILFAAAMSAARIFSAEVDLLLNRAGDEDFWDSAGSA